MRRPTIITMLIAIVIASLPLVAQADNCDTGGIYRLGDSPLLDRDTINHPEVNFEIVGYFLWVRIGDEGDLVSVEIPDNAVAVEVCDTARVSFTTETVEVEAPTEPELPTVVPDTETEVVEDLYAYWQYRGFDVGPR